ncbi:hypothetical protein ACHAWF_007760 [Thalassiosira exigua]
MATAKSNATSSALPPSPVSAPLFLRAKFEVPQLGGNSDERAGGHGTGIGGCDDNVESKEAFAVKEQSFDASKCAPAILGLPDGVDPVKPQPGDFSYSGMHDQGPLPPPKEGGEFAQIIGLVNSAKKASDEYLTDLIEKEKEANAASDMDGVNVARQKRKRK